jgi:hypothetical protein
MTIARCGIIIFPAAMGWSASVSQVIPLISVSNTSRLGSHSLHCKQHVGRTAAWPAFMPAMGMAGHSKWHNIRHKKGAEDHKRSIIYAKIAYAPYSSLLPRPQRAEIGGTQTSVFLYNHLRCLFASSSVAFSRAPSFFPGLNTFGMARPFVFFQDAGAFCNGSRRQFANEQHADFRAEEGQRVQDT